MEQAVVAHLKSIKGLDWAHLIHSFTISDPLLRPWGQPVRVVEWMLGHNPDACRRAVPADSTPQEIALALVSHRPGRRVGLQHDS